MIRVNINFTRQKFYSWRLNKDLILLELLFGAWFSVGLLMCLAGWWGGWYWPVAMVLIFPLLVLGMWSWHVLGLVSRLSFWQKGGVSWLGGIWVVHLLGVLTPEVAFDAVWYHLPVVAAFAQAHRFIYLPELYQSLNPYFSDAIFLAGYLGGGETGAKIVAYLFGLSLLAVVYKIGRLFLSLSMTIWLLISVSLIQVVTWQVSSFYVDLALAWWELCALYFLMRAAQARELKRQNLLGMALAVGAALATKSLVILSLPFFIFWLVVINQSMSFSILLILILLLPAAFFAGRSWQLVGDPLYGLTLHVQKLAEIGGATSTVKYITQRLVSWPLSAWQLLLARDYVSPLIFLCWPFLLVQGRSFFAQRPNQILFSFAIIGWLRWWFVPPLSTRYALSGFVAIVLLMLMVTEKFIEKHQVFRVQVFVILVLISIFLCLPRLYVARRQAIYLLGFQTKSEYLKQFFDGNIDRPLKEWHQLR